MRFLFHLEVMRNDFFRLHMTRPNESLQYSKFVHSHMELIKNNSLLSLSKMIRFTVVDNLSKLLLTGFSYRLLN